MPKANKHTQVFRIVFLTPFAIHLCVSCYEQEHGRNWRSVNANLQDKKLPGMILMWSSPSDSPPQRSWISSPSAHPSGLLLLKLGGLAGWLFCADAEICPAVSCLKASLFFVGVIRTFDRNRISNYIGRGNIGIHL